jgi:hypothetical protein
VAGAAIGSRHAAHGGNAAVVAVGQFHTSLALVRGHGLARRVGAQAVPSSGMA